MTSPDSPQIDLLFEEYLRGTLTEVRALVLLELLRDPRNVEFFAESMMGDFMLNERAILIRDRQMSLPETEIYGRLQDSISWRNARIPLLPSPVAPSSSASIRKAKTEKQTTSENSAQNEKFKRQPLWPLIVTLIAFLCLIVPVIWNSVKENNEPFQEIERPQVARVTELIDPVWEDENAAFVRGQETGNSQIALKSGTIGLEFANGAIVVLEGPADLLLKDGLHAFCSQGKISTYVPPESIGFTIDTPFGSIIDQGTAFYVHVTKTGAQLGVEKGRVDFLPGPNQPVTNMVRNQAIQVGINGKPQTQVFDPKAYLDYTTFYEFVEERTLAFLMKKEQADRILDDDPNLLARFDFTQNGKNDIQNCSLRGQKTISQAIPISIRTGEGPLRGTKSALLRDDSSQMTVALPQTLNSLTMSATIRIDRFHDGSNVLFASGKHQTIPGALLWQVLPNGEVQLHVRGIDGAVDYYSVHKVLSRRQLGTWLTLAVSLNAAKKEIVFYVDNKIVSRQKWKKVMPIALGQATLGNVPVELQRGESRSLCGAMSEWKLTVP